MLASAYNNWPESHDFQPESAEHLRAWLICKAGYRQSTLVELGAVATPEIRAAFVLAIEAAVRAARGTAFVVPHKGGAAVITPVSIAWPKLEQKEFGLIRSAVEDTIVAETGMSADMLLKGSDAEPRAGTASPRSRKAGEHA